MLGFTIVSDVHYNNRRKKDVENIRRVLEKISASGIKYILVDLGDVLTNPTTLYNKGGHIYVAGNHDFEKVGVRYNNRKLHTEYFENEIEGLESLLSKNGFGTDLGNTCENFEYKIFKINYKRATVYFTHLRPNKKIREQLISSAENKSVYIIYGHAHKKTEEEIKEYYLGNKKVTEYRVLTFKENKIMYFLTVADDYYSIKKIFI